MGKAQDISVRFWSKVDKNGPIPAHMPHLGPCWVWTAGFARRGYGRIWLDGRNIGAHRLSWILVNSEVPDDRPFVLHRCDNPPCVNPAHLFVGTHDDNMRDRFLKGGYARGEQSPSFIHRDRMARGDRNGSRTKPESRPRGERNTSAKMTAIKVREIRALYQSGITQVVLATRFDITQASISAITRRATWKHITP